MSREQVEAHLKFMRFLLSQLSPEKQEDIETIARSFRNTLALGTPAVMAFALVAAELSLQKEQEK